MCSHGKKDPYCAVFGRPIVRALADARAQVFESTHVGGDRFASGMVALPDGSYYGHLEPSTAEHIIERRRRPPDAEPLPWSVHRHSCGSGR
ncbi:hypothetical protein A2J03_03055 [Rhodococcus sp. EPR-157]|nr:hypothetical protein A2J03_03055 [Rhodococcus sp. EPR-157]